MEAERYLRHSLIHWFNQDELKNSRVLVIGAGAIGNELLKNLSLLGIGNIHIVDFDKIEAHNLTRSVLFSEADIGRYKAEVTAEGCRRIDPNITVSYSTDDFWKSLAIDDLRKFDGVFSCVDNFEARLRLNELCLIARVDLYNAGIDSKDVTVEKFPFASDRECACYQCNLPNSVYERIGERYSCGWLKKRAFEERKVPTTTITSSLAGAHLSALYLHKKHESSPQGALLYFIDSITLSSTTSKYSRNELCLCADKRCDIQHLKAKRGMFEDALGQIPLRDDVTIYLSDKVILDITCKKCGHSDAVIDLANKYDDSLTLCQSCNEHSVDVRIVDMLAFSEMQRYFTSRPLPVKYIYLYLMDMLFIIELEG